MNIKKVLTLILTIIIISITISGCNNSEQKNTSTEYVTLIVTTDFGRETLFDEKVAIQKGYTVMEILEENLQIETKYNGSFISSINGIENDNGAKSGQRKDWFYYINGICADQGAMAYNLNNGDTIWWDYHEWGSTNTMNTSVIGSFPEPFAHGYGVDKHPTIIMSTEANTNLANGLKKALEQAAVQSVEIHTLDETLLQNKKGPTIVIGEWNEVKEIEYIQTLNKAYKKAGLNMHFNGKELELFKSDGTIAMKKTKHTGMIASFGEGLGDAKPVWLVLGLDDKGVENAVNILINHPEEIKKMYNVVVTSEEIIRLPIK